MKELDLVEFVVIPNARIEKYFIDQDKNFIGQELIDNIQLLHEQALVMNETRIDNFNDWVICQYILLTGMLETARKELQ